MNGILPGSFSMAGAIFSIRADSTLRRNVDFPTPLGPMTRISDPGAEASMALNNSSFA
jgi:hypothetical protein